jgi:endonuclease YncB( thermonuclease family)
MRSRAGRRRSVWLRLFDYTLAVAILGLLTLLAARFDVTKSRRLEGMAAVADGDSITLGGKRIRLLGIDAPELTQICSIAGSDYPCGRRAREALVRAIDGRPVTCAGGRRDRYDRLLASCKAGGAELNRMQVEAGWAVAYGDFEAEEKIAQSSRSGLWAGAFEQPRDWRARHGGMAESEHDAIGRILDWLRQAFRLS